MKTKPLIVCFIIVALSVSTLAGQDTRLADAAKRQDKDALRTLLKQHLDLMAQSGIGSARCIEKTGSLFAAQFVSSVIGFFKFLPPLATHPKSSLRVGFCGASLTHLILPLAHSRILRQNVLHKKDDEAANGTY